HNYNPVKSRNFLQRNETVYIFTTHTLCVDTPASKRKPLDENEQLFVTIKKSKIQIESDDIDDD
ncbi:unnamed protein product, partial [Didymodactylos carnosus]